MAAFVWCALVLFLHWIFPSFACGWDTSYCAHSRDKDGVYRGVLVDPLEGKELTDTSFTVAFESRRNEDPRDVGGFSTDHHAYFCIMWAQERINPFAHVNGREASDIRDWQPLEGSDPPRGCQAGDHGIPWNRADDMKSSPQFVSVAVLGGLSMALLLIGLVLGGAHAARWPRAAGIALTVTTTAVAAIVWFV